MWRGSRSRFAVQLRNRRSRERGRAGAAAEQALPQTCPQQSLATLALGSVQGAALARLFPETVRWYRCPDDLSQTQSASSSLLLVNSRNNSCHSGVS